VAAIEEEDEDKECSGGSTEESDSEDPWNVMGIARQKMNFLRQVW